MPEPACERDRPSLTLALVQFKPGRTSRPSLEARLRQETLVPPSPPPTPPSGALSRPQPSALSRGPDEDTALGPCLPPSVAMLGLCPWPRTGPPRTAPWRGQAGGGLEGTKAPSRSSALHASLPDDATRSEWSQDLHDEDPKCCRGQRLDGPTRRPRAHACWGGAEASRPPPPAPQASRMIKDRRYLHSKYILNTCRLMKRSPCSGNP